MSWITNDLNLVIEKLSTEDIVAIPTETVYGLAAAADSDHAIRKVFATKRRPIDHPLIMHIAPEWDITQWVAFIPDYAYRLMETFWPGPLTLVLPTKPNCINPLISGGQSSIAIRAPDHPLAQTILLELGKPIVAPSANPYGKVSPTTALHVQQSFPHHDFFILDGGRCSIGLESTIVSALLPHDYQILRHGMVHEAQIATLLSRLSVESTTNIRVPGRVLTHYQPQKILYYAENLEKVMHDLKQDKILPFVFTFLTSINDDEPYAYCYQFPSQSEAAAYEFYYRLRIADQSDADCILIELPPKTQAWSAILEKIVKAGKLMS